MTRLSPASLPGIPLPCILVPHPGAPLSAGLPRNSQGSLRDCYMYRRCHHHGAWWCIVLQLPVGCLLSVLGALAGYSLRGSHVKTLLGAGFSSASEVKEWEGLRAMLFASKRGQLTATLSSPVTFSPWRYTCCQDAHTQRAIRKSH